VREHLTVEVPVRVCDVGGWTDTWFAGHGRVCSLAVGPGVVVEAVVGGEGLVLDVGSGHRFAVGEAPEEHLLLASAVAEAAPHHGLGAVLTVRSVVPPGSSLGTSAAVCVGLIAALDHLTGRSRSAGQLAAAAHRAEAGRSGRQSGVQDQLAAAHGGALAIEVSAYPRATVRRVPVPADVRRRLDERLLHVAYGGPHDSSAVHAEVIEQLAGEGPGSRRMEELRGLAAEAEIALAAGDLVAYGAVLARCTSAQAALHDDLVSADAHALIGMARAGGALGWKVNGAGGRGGSISILCTDTSAREALADAAAAAGHRPLRLRLVELGARVTS